VSLDAAVREAVRQGLRDELPSLLPLLAKALAEHAAANDPNRRIVGNTAIRAAAREAGWREDVDRVA